MALASLPFYFANVHKWAASTRFSSPRPRSLPPNMATDIPSSVLTIAVPYVDLMGSLGHCSDLLPGRCRGRASYSYQPRARRFNSEYAEPGRRYYLRSMVDRRRSSRIAHRHQNWLPMVGRVELRYVAQRWYTSSTRRLGDQGGRRLWLPSHMVSRRSMHSNWLCIMQILTSLVRIA